MHPCQKLYQSSDAALRFPDGEYRAELLCNSQAKVDMCLLTSGACLICMGVSKPTAFDLPVLQCVKGSYKHLT